MCVRLQRSLDLALLLRVEPRVYCRQIREFLDVMEQEAPGGLSGYGLQAAT